MKIILGIIVIFIIILVLFYHYYFIPKYNKRLSRISEFPIEEQDLKFIESMKQYNQHAESLFRLFNYLGLEWWPTEGTLIGILRYGGNFGKLPSIGYIATDTDIDIMVRAESDQQWEELVGILSKKITSLPGYKRCDRMVAAEQVNVFDKLTCYTNDYIFVSDIKQGYYDIHTDIHRYLVNETENYAYTNTSTEGLYYPLQYWKNRIPYRGMVCDEQGNFKKALFNTVVVPCPFKAAEILQNWNGGEYSSSEIAMPAGGIIKKDNHYKWIDNEKEGTFYLNKYDKDYLKKITKKLFDRGYESFYHLYQKMTCDVIVPCISTHIQFLEDLISDINNQTRKPDRVIIALSETKYQPSKLLEESLKKIFNNVVVISTEKQQKSWDNRDRGAIHSHADVYCFLDADDRVHPQRYRGCYGKI